MQNFNKKQQNNAPKISQEDAEFLAYEVGILLGAALQYAGVKTEKLQEDTGMWDAAQAKDKMDAWLAGPTGSKIEVVISNNDGMALGALEALKAHQKKLPVFGVDALQEALTLIESGELAGTVLNDGTNQAKAVLELSRNLANGKDPIEGTSWKLEEKAVRVPYVGVDKENLAQFKK